ncbi:hypothetical protein [Kitasatospora sp. NPDC088351]|uniref:hypothetical protein n=1 Tax=Kitasatospora sp. NPDC088351 TaxID=3155180 RepID=UPI0034418DC6
MLLDTDATVGSLLVEPTGALTFAADRTLTLASDGNVEIRGTLALAPEGAAVHTVRFPSVDERRFQGDGAKVVDTDTDTDTGLWVTGAGYLRLDGAAKTAWVRADRELRAGDTSIGLAAEPTGWLPGDELAVTPTGPPDAEDFSARYDLVTVRSVSGSTVTLDSPLKYAHPRVTAGGGVTVGAELLNLTRGVRVEGTVKGRAHVHVTGSRPADVWHAALRWVGPRADTEKTWKGQDGTVPVTAPVLGRYGLHFHMLGDTTRGTVVEGVVVRDAGSHAFVPHASHGITFRSCVSHDTWEDASWWDGPLDTRTPQRPSDDIVHESCVASRTRLEPNPRAYRLTGFNLGAGTGGRAVDCVAVGVQGATGASGHEWPENSEGVWTFQRCLAHNNLQDGIFVWLNARHHHVVTELAAYHNGGRGIEHGAYLNDFDYTASVLYGNAAGGVAPHALGRDKGSLFDGLLIDAAGHELAGEAVTFSRSRFTGYRKAGVAFRAAADGKPDDVAVLDCEFGGNELWMDPESAPPRSIVLRRAGRSRCGRRTAAVRRNRSGTPPSGRCRRSPPGPGRCSRPRSGSGAPPRPPPGWAAAPEPSGRPQGPERSRSGPWRRRTAALFGGGLPALPGVRPGVGDRQRGQVGGGDQLAHRRVGAQRRGARAAGLLGGRGEQLGVGLRADHQRGQRGALGAGLLEVRDGGGHRAGHVQRGRDDRDGEPGGQQHPGDPGGGGGLLAADGGEHHAVRGGRDGEQPGAVGAGQTGLGEADVDGLGQQRVRAQHVGDGGAVLGGERVEFGQETVRAGNQRHHDRRGQARPGGLGQQLGDGALVPGALEVAVPDREVPGRGLDAVLLAADDRQQFLDDGAGLGPGGRGHGEHQGRGTGRNLGALGAAVAPPRTGAWGSDGQWRARDGCGAHGGDRRTSLRRSRSRLPFRGR